MNEIYSEKELLPSGLTLGQWEFSLSDDQINEKLNSLLKNADILDEGCAHWKTLLSLVTDKKEKINNETSKSDSVILLDEEGAMEYSSGSVRLEEGNANESDVLSNHVEDITVSVVDSCNQAAQKVKSGFDCVEEEMKTITDSLEVLNESLLCKVMESAWTQLHNDTSKMCFCVAFSLKFNWCVILCKNIMLPWMSKSLPSKLEQFSEIFSKQGDVVCRNLIAPLLLSEDSPLVKDLPSLEEIMSCLSKNYWTILLKALLSGLTELHSWFVPVLAEVVGHSDPSLDDLGVLVQLMSSSGLNSTKSRDFGALIVAVANRMKPGFGALVPQLKLIANSYKGPLKFKVLKVLNDFKN